MSSLVRLARAGGSAAGPARRTPPRPAAPPTPVPRWSRRSRWSRGLVALLVGILAAAVTFRAQVRLEREGGRSDLAVPLRAVSTFLEGRDVYTTFGTGRSVPLAMNYPAPALVVIAPLARLPLHVAEGIFMGAGFALLAYALTASAWWPLIGLLGWPALLACRSAQWSPLLTAAALLPGLGWLLACKPNLGAALAVQRCDRRWWTGAVAGGAVLLAVTLARRPDWPWAWWAMLTDPRTSAVDSQNMLDLFVAPIRHPLGPVLLLALLRWRLPEARLVVALACVPHVPMGYDTLPLLVSVPRSRAQALALTVASWVFAFAYATWALAPTIAATFHRARSLLVLCLYLPALALVLRRPNVGVVPAWVERALWRYRIPAWLAGRATPADAARSASVESAAA